MVTRASILLLLVLNLGVAAWWALRPAASPPAAATDPAVARLQLVQEVRTIPHRVADARMPPQASTAPQACFEAAQAMAARIVAAGFKDYYVVPDGEEANSIALGRYGNAGAAQRRQVELQAAGFAAQAEPLGAGPRWIQLAATAAFDIARLQPGIAARQRPLDCASMH